MPVTRDELVPCEERLSAAVAERDQLRAQLQLSWIRHRPEEQTAGDEAISADAGPIDDRDLIRRIIFAYAAANETDLGNPDSFWLQTFAELKRPIHDALLKGDPAEIGAILQNPSRSMLFYGFDSLFANYSGFEGWSIWHRQLTYDNLLRLVEAVGKRRLENPELADATAVPADSEILLTELDNVFGFYIEFPNPFPGEPGLATSRGVATYRAIQALYQAWRIADLARAWPRCRVVEIGAGLGRTAYYAREFGLQDYTIIDIPITGVAQAYFLGRVLGEEGIQLYTESGRDRVRILPPASFFDSRERFDLVINVDSLTEMAPETASRYWREIEGRASAFLSINNESNIFTMRDLYAADQPQNVSRFPYWMRRGYVEELILLE